MLQVGIFSTSTDLILKLWVKLFLKAVGFSGSYPQVETLVGV